MTVVEVEDVDGVLQAVRDEALDLLHAASEDTWEAVPVDAQIFAKGRREMDDLVAVGEPERWEDA